MQLLDFLNDVLPDSGWFFSATRKSATDDKGRPYTLWAHAAFDDRAKLAQALIAIDQEGRDAYYALASFAAPSYTAVNKRGEARTKTRTQENAQAVKAFWVDLDCGEGKNYPDKAAGLRALLDLCSADPIDAKLPLPTYLVVSGRGLHGYWVLTEPLPVDRWLDLAKVFKSCVIDLGLYSDAQLIANSACVLRPPGTRNWKDPSKPKPVGVLDYQEGVRYTPQEFTQRVLALAELLGIEEKRAAPEKHRYQVSPDNPYAAGIDLDGNYPPMYAETLAAHCPTIRAVRDTKGADQGYYPWFYTLCILINSVEGASDDFIHSWLSAHKDYDYDDVQRKIERLRDDGMLPVSCRKIAEYSSLCRACPHFGRLNTPAPLGYRTEGHTVQDEVVDADGHTVQLKIDEFPPLLKGRFRWDESHRKLSGKKRTRTKDGEWEEEWVSFASFYFKIAFLWKDTAHDNGFHARMEVHVRRDRKEIYDVPLSAIGRGGATLYAEISHYLGIVPTTHIDLLEKYVRLWCDSLRQESDLFTVRRAMGWQADGSFLLGDRLYRPDGKVDKAVVTKDLTRRAAAHELRGDLATYTAGIDRLYNRPDRVHHQIMWIASFASSLVALYDNQPIGLILTAVSPKSGTGKTSVAMAGISVWANPYANGQVVSADGATDYAFVTLAGERRHMPLLFDETTQWSAERFANFAYRYSQGVPKMQGRQEGGIRDNSHLFWQNILYMTSNTTPSAKVLARHGNAGPMLARMFEITFPEVDLNRDDPEGVEVMRELLRNHSAVAGDRFIRAVVKVDKERLRDVIKDEVAVLNTTLNADSAERYWVLFLACARIAFDITRKIGLHRFDKAAFNDTLLWCFKDMRGVSAESQESIEDIVGAMLADFNGGMLVTRTEGKNTPDPNNILKSVHANSVVGRIIMEGDKAGIYIRYHALRSWCVEHNHDIRTLREKLLEHGYLLNDGSRLNLGTGTFTSVGRPRSWRLSYEKFQGEAAHYITVDRPGDVRYSTKKDLKRTHKIPLAQVLNYEQGNGASVIEFPGRVDEPAGAAVWVGDDQLGGCRAVENDAC
jgi:hypothetical protein